MPTGGVRVVGLPIGLYFPNMEATLGPLCDTEGLAAASEAPLMLPPGADGTGEAALTTVPAASDSPGNVETNKVENKCEIPW